MYLKTRLKLIGLAALSTLILYISAQTLSPYLQTLSAPTVNTPIYLQAAGNSITLGGLFCFCALIAIAKLEHARSRNSGDNINAVIRPRLHLAAWTVSTLTLALWIAGVTVYVDPRGLFETNRYHSYNNPSRRVKTWNYPQLSQTPTILVMGSSRAFSISPEHIHELLGVTAFNASIESGKLNDFIVQARLMMDQRDQILPEVLLIEVADGFIDNYTYTQIVAPLPWLRYLPIAQTFVALDERLGALLNLQSISEAIVVLKVYEVYGTGIIGWQFKPDGEGFADWIPDDDRLRQSVQDTIERRRECPQLNASGIEAFNQLVSLAEQHGSSIVFYIPPPHPDFYAVRMGDNPDFVRCATPFRDFVSKTLPAYDNIFLLDFSKLADIGGDDTAQGYYDAVHMTSLNNNLLLDAAADTLRKALRLADQKRRTLTNISTD